MEGKYRGVGPIAYYRKITTFSSLFKEMNRQSGKNEVYSKREIFHNF